METDWLHDLHSWHAHLAAGGLRFVVFPAYRPDLARDVAARLGLRFVDFRETVMAPLKWDAARLTLADLDDVIDVQGASGPGTVLMNVEALLSLKTAHERAAWFAAGLARPLPAPVLLPLVLYANELPPAAQARSHSFNAADLPEETLLDRLRSLAP